MAERRKPPRKPQIGAAATIFSVLRELTPAEGRAFKGLRIRSGRGDTSRYDPKTNTILLQGLPSGKEGRGLLKHELGHAILQKRFPLRVPSDTGRHHRILSRAGLGVTDTSTAGAARGRLGLLDKYLKAAPAIKKLTAKGWASQVR